MDATARRSATQPLQQRKLSDKLAGWLQGDGEKTLGALIELFGRDSFALLFVLLLAVPALPLPTGGATHVFEAIAVLLSVQLLLGRRQNWLPQRWRRLQLAGPRQRRLIDALLRLVRWLE